MYDNSISSCKDKNKRNGIWQKISHTVGVRGELKVSKQLNCI